MDYPAMVSVTFSMAYKVLLTKQINHIESGLKITGKDTSKSGDGR